MADAFELYLQRCRDEATARTAAGAEPEPARAGVVADVVAHVAATLGQSLAVDDLRLFATAAPGSAAALAPMPGLAGPWLPGRVYEALLEPGERRRAGAVYTPGHVAERLVAETLGRLDADPARVRVCDPACGGGAFLLAVVTFLQRRGVGLGAALRACVGVDRDPVAVAVTEASLALLAGGRPPAGLAGQLRAADALDAGVAGMDGVDAVVGNPPFGSQLASATARDAAAAQALRQRFGDAATGYVDTAAVFVLLALELVRNGGVVGLVLPESVLVARDAAGVRRAIAEQTTLRWLWRAGEPVFAAGAHACALVLGPRGRPAPLERAAGRGLVPVSALEAPPARLAQERPWSWLVADMLGVPAVDLDPAWTLAGYCTATADFRDQFYGLVPFAVDDVADESDPRAWPKLITSGLIDPAHCRWGEAAARFAGRRYQRPRVDLARLRAAGTLAAWADARLRPKVLMATQTPVLEVAVDEAGAWLPVTPVITVTADDAWLWHVAAALTSPPLSAWALTHHTGAALSPGALKLSARQVIGLPAPRPGADWDAAAARLRAAADAPDEPTRRGHLEAVGAAMCRAYGVGADSGVLGWWLARLPRR